MPSMTFINSGFINAHNKELDIAFTNTGTNLGLMEASGSGVLKVAYGTSAFTPTASFINKGLIDVEKGASATITDTVGNNGQSVLSFAGTMTNDGLMNVNGGHLTIDTPLKQAAYAATLVENNGTLTLNSSSDGGTIVIQSGMLDFGDFGFNDYLGSIAALNFRSNLDFIGATGSIHVGNQGLTLAFKDATQELIISGITNRSAGGAVPLADIHLTGGHYSLADFSVNNTTHDVLFHRV